MGPNAENHSWLLYGPLDARFENRPFPVLNDPRDVVVRIVYTGICGSDVSNLPCTSTDNRSVTQTLESCRVHLDQ
jgi:threonine dehydrogenase-like Zn-dependent dehydrogenase